MSKALKIFTFCLFAVMPILGISQKFIVLQEGDKEVKIENNCWVYKDATSAYGLNNIFEIPFEKPKTESLNFGYSNATAWIKIDIENQSNARWLLELGNPSMNDIWVYLFQNQQLISQFRAGDNHPFSSYSISDRNPIFDLQLLHNQSYTIFIAGKTTEDLNFPLTLCESKKLYEHLANRNLLWGFYFGFILLIVLYNVFLWLTTHDKTYLYYILYVASFGLFQFSLYGFGFQYVWSNSAFNEYAHSFFVGCSVTFLVLFSIHFLDLFKEIPNSKKIFQIVGFVWVIVFPLMVFTFNHRSVFILMIISAVGLFFQYYFSIKLLRKGNRAVRFYLLATVAMSVAILIILLKTILNIPGDFYLKLGSMIEMVLFSAALGDKYRQIELDRIRQQRIRDEISANLHDDLAASLSSLTMFSELNRRKAMKVSAEYTEIFKNISEKSREILNMVRENVWEMNPRNDASEEWLDRMVKFAKEILEAKQIDLDLNISDEIQRAIIPIDQRRDLFFFFKECINNAAKYSEANLVKVQLSKQNNFLKLMIQDNGKGFEISHLNSGNGLINLKNRAEKLNGKYNIESRFGEGTTISLSFRIATNISS